jgi:hypothetical protein
MSQPDKGADKVCDKVFIPAEVRNSLYPNAVYTDAALTESLHPA